MATTIEIPEIELGERSSVVQTVSRWLNVAVYHLTGFLVCAARGKLDRYSYLLAQAKLESLKDLSAPTFTRDACPWGMHAGSITKRRNGERVTTDGLRAHYMGIVPNWYGAWMDRLDWDDVRGVSATQRCPSYAMDVVASGWFGSSTDAVKLTNYVNAWVSVHERQVSFLPKLFNGEGIAARYTKWAGMALVVLIAAWISFKLYKWLRRKFR
jgi:hypothetical protein